MKDCSFTLDYIGGNCPVQAEGSIDGKPFYFRARWDRWTMGIGGKPVSDPDVLFEGDYGAEGGMDAGWMPVYEALGVISNCFSLYCTNQGDDEDDKDH